MIRGRVTHYGESYNGQTLGCSTGAYDSHDQSIVAVGPGYTEAWPCGTALTICGDVGCITGTRQDYCPQCYGAWLDLSEAGIAVICGIGAGTCPVTIEEEK